MQRQLHARSSGALAHTSPAPSPSPASRAPSWQPGAAPERQVRAPPAREEPRGGSTWRGRRRRGARTRLRRPGPALALPPRPPPARSARRAEVKVKVGPGFPAPPYSPRPGPRLPPPPRPSHRPPARLSAPSSPAFRPPRRQSRRRPTEQPPLPPERLGLPLTPATGQEEASSPLGLLSRFPAATNGPPPPGSRARPLAVEDRADAAAGRRKGGSAEGGVAVRLVAGRPALRNLHQPRGSQGGAAGRPVTPQGEGRVCRTPLPRSQSLSYPDLRA